MLDQAPVTRFDTAVQEDAPDAPAHAAPGGFFTPQSNFGAALQLATSPAPKH